MKMIEIIAEQIAFKQREEALRRQDVYSAQINPARRYTLPEVEAAMGTISGAIMRGSRIQKWKIVEEPGWFQVDVTSINQYNMQEREYWYFYRVLAQEEVTAVDE